MAGNNQKLKIYKFANKMSIVDVLSALNYHKENNNGDLIYKGNIAILINEYGSSGKISTGYIRKENAKVLFWSIMNNMFERDFPDGFIEYGGSRKNNIVRARTITVKKKNNKYEIAISDGPGKITKTGAYQFIKQEIYVHSLIDETEAKKMAHEVYSFIQQTEMLSFMNGKPLYTILNNQSNQQSSNEDLIRDANSYESSQNVNNNYYNQSNTQPLPIQENNRPQPQTEIEDDYKIPFGSLKGVSLKNMITSDLQLIASKLASNNKPEPEFIDLLKHIKVELSKRI